MILSAFSKYKKILLEIILYGIIGLLAATTDSIIFYLFNKMINIYLCNFISINIGIGISFLLNTYVNFRKIDNLLVRASRFYTIGYIGLLLSMLILYFGVEILKYYEIYVKIFSVFIVAAFQFTLNKLITFKEIA